MGATRAGGRLAVLLACLGASPALAQPPTGGPGSLNGVWNAVGHQAAKPPLTPQAKARLEEHNRLVASGKAAAGNIGCVPPGMPSLMDPADKTAIQFVETPDQKQITVLSESYRTFRVIHLGAMHPVDPDPTFQGHSIGHWEGDTLVVDTIGLKETTDVFGLGIPHTGDMHLVEHIRRAGKTRLEDLMTIEDPKVFSRPFAVKITLKSAPGKLMGERVCKL